MNDDELAEQVQKRIIEASEKKIILDSFRRERMKVLDFGVNYAVKDAKATFEHFRSMVRTIGVPIITAQQPKELPLSIRNIRRKNNE